MKKGSFGQSLAVFFVIIGVLYIIGSVSEANEPKCIKAGCDNKQATGSNYCYLHKPYTGSSSYSSSSNSSGSSSSNNLSGSSAYKSNSSGKKSSSYSSYDDGYDSIYDDDDYDYDRYNSDSDYADGVDEAILNTHMAYATLVLFRS